MSILLNSYAKSRPKTGKPGSEIRKDLLPASVLFTTNELTSNEIYGESGFGEGEGGTRGGETGGAGSPPLDVDGWLPVSFTDKNRQTRRAVQDYLEATANVSASFPDFDQRTKLLQPGCGDYAVFGVCEEGHKWGKVILCGRQWCPVCGENGSESHMRRFARAWPKIAQVKELGTWVVTFPDSIVYRFMTPESISMADLAIRQVLIKHGFDRGGSFWHFFGDKSPRYRPHFNAMVDHHGWIPTKKINEIRNDLASVFKVDKVVVNYRFTKDTGHIIHRLKYITRATFTNNHLPGNEELARRFIGFRNMRWWGRGKWGGEAIHVLKGEENTPDIVNIAKGTCPDCGSKVKWTADVVSALEWQGEKIGGGFLRLQRKSRNIGKIGLTPRGASG